MARNLYGCTSADFTLTAGGRLSPGAVLTLWTARTGGTRITDLLTVDGTPITEVVSGGDASIAYQGPDNDKSVHWADSGQGARTAIRPVDITGAVGPTGGVGPIGPPGASVGALTTKGDLLVRDSGAGVRLPVGADNRVLTADASQAAGMRWATPTTRVGTGSPLGIVTPDFVGQRFIDTAQTLGAREWVATGITAASWVVSDGDTGWIDVTAGMNSTHRTAFPSAKLFVKRMPGRVSFIYMQGSATATFSGLIWTLPVGWRLTNAAGGYDLRFFPTTDLYASVLPSQTLSVGGPGVPEMRASSWAALEHRVHGDYACTEPWPTSAPV